MHNYSSSCINIHRFASFSLSCGQKKSHFPLEKGFIWAVRLKYLYNLHKKVRPSPMFFCGKALDKVFIVCYNFNNNFYAAAFAVRRSVDSTPTARRCLFDRFEIEILNLFSLEKEKFEMSKKILCLALVMIMLAMALVSCVDAPEENTTDASTNEEESTTGGSDVNYPTTPVDKYAGKEHIDISDALYKEVLGEFDTYYKAAKEATDVSEKFALMAIAEAKLLSTGVMLPSTANGGNYAISRVAPGSITSVLWGNDSDRFYTAVIVKGNPLTPSERNEMKAEWNKPGTGEAYIAWAKSYLTNKGYTLSDTYTFGYTSDPQTWDAVATSKAADSEAIVNTYDGLLEYDARNNQIPALAETYEVSEDGLKYTFKIRKGVKWVDYEGTVIGDLTAQSFVDGFQHMLDAQGGLEYLVDGVVVNAHEYINGDITDFSQVGVKAVDEYTLEYTLEKPTSYFTTMLGYNVFAPMCKTVYVANGGVFGVAEFQAASETEAYTYGQDHTKIAYCGPYLVKSATAKNSIVFEANPSYWNKDNVQIKTIKWQFISGKDALESYNLMKDGTFAGAGLNSAAAAQSKTDGLFEKYAYVSGTDATSFPVFMNLYRAQYHNYNDDSAAVSTLSDLEKVRANVAMQNKSFRLALATSLDRGAYNATVVGDDLKLASLVNSYTPGNFVKLEKEVTVKINGTDKTYPAGTYYGVIMQDQLTADGIDVKVWDPQADDGVGASFGFDGWYNVEFCRENLAKAVEELKAQGVEITKENPLKLEVPYFDVDPNYSARAAALEQSIEASTESLVDIVLIKCGGEDAANWYYATYYAPTGEEANYNIMDNSGWGPDYGDPSTYLDTMFYGGYMLKCIGLY